jgi:energy-coupling factor transporter ATP-binding protein EcfA2
MFPEHSQSGDMKNVTARLANRLSQARRQRFVGRSAELELFRAALSQDVPNFAVLHLHGPGGMGKTTLLRQFAQIAEETDRPCVPLDGRHLDASPTGFLTALQLALRLPPETDPLEAIANLPNLILLLDTYELLSPLDGWLREMFIPQLPERALVIIAGRPPPPAAWRADDGWGELTRIISLRNLRPDESAAYLRGQSVPESQVEHVLGVTYGHPLALSLAADLFNQNKAASAFDLKQDPDIVRVLLEHFVVDVPDPIFRQTLEVCAHAFTTDEALLAHCLGESHAHAAFQWLRDLSFIEQGPFGLFPHDLVRELLETELRWRNLPRFRELHFQVRNHIITQIQQRSGLAQQFAVFALLFLHRNNPFIRPFYEWQSLGQLYIDVAQTADMPIINQLFRRHQGEESLAAARYGQTRPQATFFVFRAAGGAVAGFCQVLEIGQATAEDMAVDPAVATAVRYLQTNAPLRPGDIALYFRNWMDADH